MAEARSLRSRNSEQSLVYSPAISEDDENVKVQKMTISFDYDIYDATVVAAFGGVYVGHGNHEDDQEPLHAFWLFVPSFLLFLVQGCLLGALSLDLDLSADFSLQNEKENRILVSVKVAVYFIVQLQLFSSILGTFQKLIFVFSCSTWDHAKTKRPNPSNMTSKFKWTYNTWCVLPWTVFSLVFKLIIDYSVCVTSLSVILLADDAVDALFNSLAIAWISDLDGMVWNAFSTVTMLDVRHFENFHFECFVSATDDEPRQNRRRKKRLQLCTWSYGIKICINLFMLFMYWRQCVIVHMAIDSNNIPAARDVCTAWRWIEGPDAVPLLNKVLNLIPLGEAVGSTLVKHADPEHGGYCDASYNPMSFDDMIAVSARHPSVFVVMTSLTLLFFSPYLVTLVSRHCGSKPIDLIKETNIMDDNTNEADGVANHPRIMGLQRDLDLHKNDLMTHKQDHGQKIEKLQQLLERHFDERLARLERVCLQDIKGVSAIPPQHSATYSSFNKYSTESATPNGIPEPAGAILLPQSAGGMGRGGAAMDKTSERPRVLSNASELFSSGARLMQLQDGYLQLPRASSLSPPGPYS